MKTIYQVTRAPIFWYEGDGTNVVLKSFESRNDAEKYLEYLKCHIKEILKVDYNVETQIDEVLVYEPNEYIIGDKNEDINE